MPKRIVSGDSGALPAADRHKTRREALGVMTSAVVMTVPATDFLVAPADARPADPIRSVIERHKAARAEVDRLISTVDEVAALLNASTVTDADGIAYERAVQNREREFDALMATPPETTEGMRAMIAYILSFDDGYLAEYGRPTLEALLKSPLLAA